MAFLLAEDEEFSSNDFDTMKAVWCPAWTGTNCCFNCNIWNGWRV